MCGPLHALSRKVKRMGDDVDKIRLNILFFNSHMVKHKNAPSLCRRSNVMTVDTFKTVF